MLVGTCIYACYAKTYGDKRVGVDTGDSDSDTTAASARVRVSKRKAAPKSKGARRNTGTQANVSTWDDSLFTPAYVTTHGERVHISYDHVKVYAPFRIDIPTASTKAFVWCQA